MNTRIFTNKRRRFRVWLPDGRRYILEAPSAGFLREAMPGATRIERVRKHGSISCWLLALTFVVGTLLAWLTDIYLVGG